MKFRERMGRLIIMLMCVVTVVMLPIVSYGEEYNAETLSASADNMLYDKVQGNSLPINTVKANSGNVEVSIYCKTMPGYSGNVKSRNSEAKETYAGYDDLTAGAAVNEELDGSDAAMIYDQMSSEKDLEDPALKFDSLNIGGEFVIPFAIPFSGKDGNGFGKKVGTITMLKGELVTEDTKGTVIKLTAIVKTDGAEPENVAEGMVVYYMDNRSIGSTAVGDSIYCNIPYWEGIFKDIGFYAKFIGQGKYKASVSEIVKADIFCGDVINN